MIFRRRFTAGCSLVILAALFLVAGNVAAAVRLTNSTSMDGTMVVDWNSRGTLETAGQLTGPWQPVAEAPPFITTIADEQQFFRLNQTVDTTTLHRKVLAGYQGWFRCPGDGANQWIHWSRSSSQITPSTLTFEMWPDVSEYTHRYAAPGFTDASGAQSYLFSSQDAQTVDRHFDWMQEYGIDGVFLSRFIVSVGSRPTNVLVNVLNAAARTGRTVALMYDMSGQSTSTVFSQMTNDWRWLNDTLHLTQHPRYLHHNGKPVLMIWGFFSERFGTNLAHQIIDYFKNDPTYGVTLIGGGEWWWRTDTATGWSDVFRRFDVYSPWNVGNVSIDGTKKWASTGYWLPDFAAANAAGMLYLPVIYPGFSWDNLQRLTPGTSLIPRMGGDFLWKQFYDATTFGLDMAFVAMFDEVDEGTAIFKVSNTPPTQAYFVTYDGLPSDWYLRLTAAGTAMMLGERPLTRPMPISP